MMQYSTLAHKFVQNHFLYNLMFLLVITKNFSCEILHGLMIRYTSATQVSLVDTLYCHCISRCVRCWITRKNVLH